PLLLRPLERTVVGRDDREDVRAERLPEVLLMLLRARRRRVDVLRALEAGLVEGRLVDEEVLRAGLAPGIPALLTRERDRLDRRLAGDVDDVEPATSDPRELDRAVGRLGLRLHRACARMPDRLLLAVGDR